MLPWLVLLFPLLSSAVLWLSIARPARQSIFEFSRGTAGDHDKGGPLATRQTLLSFPVILATHSAANRNIIIFLLAELFSNCSGRFRERKISFKTRFPLPKDVFHLLNQTRNNTGSINSS